MIYPRSAKLGVTRLLSPPGLYPSCPPCSYQSTAPLAGRHLSLQVCFNVTSSALSLTACTGPLFSAISSIHTCLKLYLYFSPNDMSLKMWCKCLTSWTMSGFPLMSYCKTSQCLKHIKAITKLMGPSEVCVFFTGRRWEAYQLAHILRYYL